MTKKKDDDEKESGTKTDNIPAIAASEPENLGSLAQGRRLEKVSVGRRNILTGYGTFPIKARDGIMGITTNRMGENGMGGMTFSSCRNKKGQDNTGHRQSG